MKMKSIEKVQKIFAIIQDINQESISSPGLSEYKIEDTLNRLGLPVTDELLQLYQWHNGIFNLDAFMHFLSLDDAVTLYNVYRVMKEDFPGFEWNKHWFPLIDMNGDVQVCLDLVTKSLYTIDMESEETILIAQHYDDYLNAMLSVFQNKSYCFNEQAGSVEVLDDDWNQLQEEHHIKSAWA